MPLSKIPSAGTDGFGRRNLIINGAMQVAQRGTSETGIAASSDYFTADRWKVALRANEVGTWTMKQVEDGTDSETTPDGFSNALKMDCTIADTSLAANTFFLIQHVIEAQNLQHLKFGTSSALPFTVSFWVKSSKTGAYTVEIASGDFSEENTQSYTIDAADTWEHKTLTFSGLTTQEIDNDNGAGMYVQWWLGAGSNYNSGAFVEDTWTTTDTTRAHPNQVNLADSTSNDWYITGVQLEVGSVATEFEHRSFGEELALCQRYFWKTYEYETAVGSVTNDSALGRFIDDTQSYASIQIPYNPMRSQPTATIYNPSDGTTGEIRTDSADVPALITRLGSNGNGFIYVNNSSVSKSVGTTAHLTLEAEL